MRFEIPGRPVPYQRTRRSASTGGVFDHPGYADWKRMARQIIVARRVPRFDDGVYVATTVEVHSDRLVIEVNEAVGGGRPKHIRGDADNYLKACHDIMQRAGRNRFEAGPIQDDRLVVASTVRFVV